MVSFKYFMTPFLNTLSPSDNFTYLSSDSIVSTISPFSLTIYNCLLLLIISPSFYPNSLKVNLYPLTLTLCLKLSGLFSFCLYSTNSKKSL